MTGVVKIDITESAEDLKTLLREQKTAMGKERVQALYLLKTTQVETVQHLAVVLGRNRVTLQRWLSQYRTGGDGEVISSLPATGKTSEYTRVGNFRTSARTT